MSKDKWADCSEDDRSKNGLCEHIECIELEYTNFYYRAGYKDGLEAGRVIAVQMVEDERKRWEANRCETCKWQNCLACEMEPCVNCIRREYFDIQDYYEPKGSK